MANAMIAQPRVLFAGLFHETHTFVESTTPLESFAVAKGPAMLRSLGDSSPLGGALEAATACGWEIIPSLDMRAAPSGTADDLVLETFWRELSSTLTAVAAEGLDAIFLVLHGAMVCRNNHDVEGELLQRIRAVSGTQHLPVFGVFDLHANFTAAMASHSDCLVAYRENPHADARDAAVRAVHLLERALAEHRRPRTFWKHPPLMWPPTGTGSAEDPMRTLLAVARALEVQHPDFWCVNVIAGFSFADTPDTGVSFSICTTGDAAIAEAALEKLAACAWGHRELGYATESPADTVLRQALARPVAGLSVVAEPSDNIGAGAPGDGTGLMRAFLRLGVPNAAVAICDPQAVARAAHLTQTHTARIIELSIGGKGSRLDEGPLDLSVNVLSLSDGRFELEDKRSHLASMCGDFFEMGPCAVVRHKNLTILLTSLPTPPMDRGQWSSQGFAPEAFSYIGVKAAVAHRGAYAPIAERMLWVETPGPCSSRLAALPFQKITRPVFPLDPGSALQPGA